MKKNIKDSNSCRCATTSFQQIGECGKGSQRLMGGGGGGVVKFETIVLSVCFYIFQGYIATENILSLFWNKLILEIEEKKCFYGNNFFVVKSTRFKRRILGSQVWCGVLYYISAMIGGWRRGVRVHKCIGMTEIFLIVQKVPLPNLPVRAVFLSLPPTSVLWKF